MTSVFQVIAHDDSNERLAARKAVVLSKSRLEPLTDWIKGGGPQWRERYAYAVSDATAIVKQACSEVGCDDIAGIMASYEGTFMAPELAERNAREASVKEARLPKMCPWHKDVVQISLADGNARSGFDAMAQHWGGPRHCEGDGYEGEKCKFKPEMTTQSYWDTKAEKAQERKELREQQALEAPDPVEAPVEEEAPTEPVSDPADAPVIEEHEQPAVEEYAQAELELSDGAAELMSMAAKTADADGLGGPVPKMDKRKWTPQSVGMPEGVDDADGPHPTRHQDILEPIKAENGHKLKDIGEQETERQDVAKDSNPSEAGRADQGGTFGGGGKSAVSSMLDLRDDPFLPHSAVEAAIRAYRSQ